MNDTNINKNKVSIDVTTGLSLTLRLMVALFSFLLMVIYADKSSLWFDDLFTISVSRNGVPISLAIERVLKDAHSHPPLFYVFSSLWMKIAPYGTVWLRLPGIIFFALGILLCGHNAKKLKGNISAVFATLFAGTSILLMREAGLAFRQYGPLFLLVNLLIYAYIKRMDCAGQESLTDVVKYGIVLLLLLYIHYFGVLVVFAFCLCDLYLFVRKKIGCRVLFSYVVSGVLFLPWAIHAAKVILGRNAMFWAPSPTFNVLCKTMLNLCNNSFLIFLSFVCVMFFLFFLGIKKKRFFLSECVAGYNKYIVSLLTLTPIGILGMVFIYSVIRPVGSFFVRRYFISVLPMVLIVSAIGISLGFDIVARHQAVRKYKTLLFMLVFACFAFSLGYRATIRIDSAPYVVNQPYEQAIEWIYQQEEAHFPNSLTIVNGGDKYVDAIDGLEYYLTHDGKRSKFNIKSNLDFGLEKNPVWERVYRFDGQYGLSKEAEQNLEQHYIIVDEYLPYKVKVYKRKEAK